ncbi:unnamed protein product [Vitrella brassicaformis CCMP3155]|uniref:Uncharacterized protein n=1 Tax=Vitrella brassicaformis (strain CCMP3155) TaxID=1169540 RepID=A0A0G4EQR7_VITBC|nr:unnamed protein product [Vitrella brassicaformis CCMP3155]|eukprot:CEL99585.1 unnamed protein product [Vitrella brassicaformis CCMP3155]
MSLYVPPSALPRAPAIAEEYRRDKLLAVKSPGELKKRLAAVTEEELRLLLGQGLGRVEKQREIEALKAKVEAIRERELTHAIAFSGGAAVLFCEQSSPCRRLAPANAEDIVLDPRDYKAAKRSAKLLALKFPGELEKRIGHTDERDGLLEACAKRVERKKKVPLKAQIEALKAEVEAMKERLSCHAGLQAEVAGLKAKKAFLKETEEVAAAHKAEHRASTSTTAPPPAWNGVRGELVYWEYTGMGVWEARSEAQDATMRLKKWWRDRLEQWWPSPHDDRQPQVLHSPPGPRGRPCDC